MSDSEKGSRFGDRFVTMTICCLFQVAEEAEPEVGDMILVGLSYIILVLLFPLAIFQAIKVSQSKHANQTF